MVVDAPYSHLWPLRLCNIFPFYLNNATILEGKKIENNMCDLIFCITLSETIPILTGIQRVMNVNVHK